MVGVGDEVGNGDGGMVDVDKLRDYGGVNSV